MITTIMAGFAFGYCVMDIILNYRARRTADLKSKENKSIASTITPEYLKWQQNEILREAMKNGSIQKILINGASVLSIGDAVIGK